MQPKTQQRSKYHDQYVGFFGTTNDDEAFFEPSEDLLKKYRIKVTPQSAMAKRQRMFGVRLIYISQDASTASLCRSTLVNLGSPLTFIASQAIARTKDGASLGSGSFGTILTKSVAGTEFAAKLIERRNGSP
jgi:hypothetical protein